MPGIGLRGTATWSISARVSARFFQAIANRRGRKSRRVLHAIETFLFHGGQQLAVADNRGRSVPWYALIPRIFIDCAMFTLRLRPQSLRRLRMFRSGRRATASQLHAGAVGTIRSARTATTGATNRFGRQKIIPYRLSPPQHANDGASARRHIRESWLRFARRSGPRSHSSHGNVNVRFVLRATSSAGSKSLRALPAAAPLARPGARARRPAARSQIPPAA